MPTEANGPAPQTPVFVYSHLLMGVHNLIAQGKGDTEEAEAIADQMDAPWGAMTPQEQGRMRGLAADLYALREGGPKRVDMDGGQLAKWQAAAKEAHSRLEKGEVDETLEFLRRPVPAALPGYIIPFLQARCWEKLGDLETALVFRKEAERLEPSESPSGVGTVSGIDMMIHAIAKMGS